MADIIDFKDPHTGHFLYPETVPEAVIWQEDGESLREKMESIPGPVDLVDNLESERTDAALTANQGKVLKEMVDDKQDIITDLSAIRNNASKAVTIEGKIPEQASTTNQLADKAFVNSSVQTATANFRGNWTTKASIPTDVNDYPVDYAGSRIPTVNDYLVVQADESQDGGTWRYKYSGVWATDGVSGWHAEYQVNETPLTSVQLAALNSGITAALVAKIHDKQIFVAEYGVTTAQEVVDAFNAGKEVVCHYSPFGYDCIYDNVSMDDASIRFTVYYTSGIMFQAILNRTNNTWKHGQDNLELPSRKKSVIDPTSTTEYPNSKAVADYVGEIVGDIETLLTALL